MKSVLEFQKKKNNGQKITMLTCYDFTFAKLLNETDLDCILVGDSLAQIMHGHNTTLNATTDMMALHTRATVLGAPNKFVVADMPFLSTRKGLKSCMDQVEKLMQAGAHAVKIEGADGHEKLIKHIVESGVPVMGHLGLTPQSIHQLGGPKVQGKVEASANKIYADSIKLQEAGCFALVLELVPTALAARITEALEIPTIGIGAGPVTDGQVLVLQDLLGMNKNFNPKFLKKFMQGADLMTEAINQYCRETQSQKFPGKEHQYE